MSISTDRHATVHMDISRRLATISVIALFAFLTLSCSSDSTLVSESSQGESSAVQDSSGETPSSSTPPSPPGDQETPVASPTTQNVQPQIAATPQLAQDLPELPVERLTVEVLEMYPRYSPSTAWTQGLEFDGSDVIEGTGITTWQLETPAPSELRRLDPVSGQLKSSVQTPGGHYGEGITIVDSLVYQITWQDQHAHVYDLESFEVVKSFSYEGQGWGLCYDGETLWMSDGSSSLYQRDPETFTVTSQLDVSFEGAPVANINELECVDGDIYANVWQTTDILRIDSASGKVVSVIDLSAITEHSSPHKTLNGIAYDREDNTFIVTGKLWDYFYRVHFVSRS